MDITYTVNPETFLVEIFSSEQEAPFIYQPDWPSGAPFESAEDADGWAQEFIAYYKQDSNIPPRSYKDHSPEPVIFDDPEAAPVEEAPAEEPSA
jgi:hypothetical protein